MNGFIYDIHSLDNDISRLSTFLAKESGKRDNIVEEINKKSLKLAETEKELDIYDKVNILLQKTSEFAREQAKKQIEGLVTNCLQYIFDSSIEFKIEIEESYGKPNAEFYIVSQYGDEQIKTKPEYSRGGGIVDIISLALRIAFLQIHRPLIEGPIILDEPAKHVSEEYIFNVSEFLKQVSEMFNRQIIMVTHNNHLASIASKSYRVELKDTVSIVEEIID